MFEDILNKFIVIDGVSSVTVIRDDGGLVVSQKTSEFDDTHLAAIVSFVLAESKAIASKLGGESLSMVFVEFRDHILLFAPLKDEYYVVFIAKPTANIAQINFELKRNRESLIKAL